MSPSTSESSSGAQASASDSMNASPTGVSQSLVSSQWNIKDSPGSLPSIPPCYPMAQTSVLLRNTSLISTDSADGGIGGANAKTTGLDSADYNTHSPSKVAHRIARCLRDRSIYAEYDAESATAVGTSVDHVELRIKLFHASSAAAPTPPQPPPPAAAPPATEAAGSGASAAMDEDGGDADAQQSMAAPAAAGAAAGGVVVEVTRKRGCTMSFHADCRAILSAARGVHVKRPSDNTVGNRRGSGARPPPPLHRSQSMPAVTLSMQNPATMDENVALALETVEELLKKDRMDANLLGLQSLYMLSTDGNPESDKDKSAAYAAKMILLKHDGAETSSSILAMIGNLIRDWSINADDVFDDDDSDSENEEVAAGEDQDGANAEARQGSGSATFDDYYASTMHNLALGALSNILTLVCTETRWDDLPPQIRAWIEGEIVPLLVREVGLAATYLAEVESESSAAAAAAAAEAEASSSEAAAAAAPPSRQRTRPPRRVVRPHDASLAVRALTAIATMSPEMGAAALGMGLGTELIALRDVGGTVHALLAEECATAMRTLNVDDGGCEGKAEGGR